MELDSANLEAWSIYPQVHDVRLPGIMGPGPLNIPGVLQVLRWLDLEPETPDERVELLNKLRVIHAVRAELAEEERKRKPPAEHK